MHACMLVHACIYICARVCVCAEQFIVISTWLHHVQFQTLTNGLPQFNFHTALFHFIPALGHIFSLHLASNSDMKHGLCTNPYTDLIEVEAIQRKILKSILHNIATATQSTPSQSQWTTKDPIHWETKTKQTMLNYGFSWSQVYTYVYYAYMYSLHKSKHNFVFIYLTYNFMSICF